MAYTKSTLATLKQNLADRHDGGTLPTDSATLSYWIRLFNKGVQYCADALQLKKLTSLTTVLGVIALPDDFKSINAVFSGAEELTQVSPDDASSQVGFVYWITGDHDTGFTLNATADQAFTVKYAYFPADMAVDADECIIPDPEAVVAYAYSMIRRAETDPIGDAQESMDECKNRIKSMKSDYDNNNSNQEMTM
jgi:hypothetical protein